MLSGLYGIVVGFVKDSNDVNDVNDNDSNQECIVGGNVCVYCVPPTKLYIVR